MFDKRLNRTDRKDDSASAARALENVARIHYAWLLLARKYNHAHLAPIVKAFFDSFMALTRTIQELNKELKTYADKDARVALLKSMPSVVQLQR